MRKSRLNRRINAVRKNIVVKKHLLNKLEKIKRDRKGSPRRASLRPRRASLRPRRASLRPKRASLRPRRGSLRPKRASLRPKRGSLRRASLRSRRNSLPIDSLKLPYLKKLREVNNIFPKKNNMNNSSNICKFKNFHEEHIEIPDSYPGDMWVHNNLLANRDKPLEYFDEDYLKEVYSNHKKICFGV